MTEKTEKKQIAMDMNKIGKASKMIAFSILDAEKMFNMTIGETLLAATLAQVGYMTQKAYKFGMLQEFMEEMERDE